LKVEKFTDVHSNRTQSYGASPAIWDLGRSQEFAKWESKTVGVWYGNLQRSKGESSGGDLGVKPTKAGDALRVQRKSRLSP